MDRPLSTDPTAATAVRACEPIPHRYGEEAGRDAWTTAMFDASACDYDRINHWMSLGSGEWHRGRVLRRAGVREGSAVLDVACGTGVLAGKAEALAGPTGRVIGLDPSRGMLDIARRRVKCALIQGRAEELPLPDQSVDFVTMGYALRHVRNLHETFVEFKRVLRPGGRVIILEIVAPERGLRRRLAKTYLGAVVPRLAKRIGRSREAAQTMMAYYWETIEQAAPAQRVLQCMTDAGLVQPRREQRFGMLTEYFGDRP